jgi:glutamyl-tRNA synthetase/glutamyl-Q tRNA(Asp) synthetase
VSAPRLALAPGFTTRFAPAPTGYLHLGHAANAVWVWGIARAFGGRVLLRVEDHDRGRCRPEYESALLDDLDWLGLVPDGTGPETFRAGRTPQRQSDNTARYEARLVALEASGLAYPCTCSRAEIARAAEETDAHRAMPGRAMSHRATPDLPTPDGIELRYPGTCRSRALDPALTPSRRVLMTAGHAEHFDDLLLGPQSQDPDLQCGDLLARDRHRNFTYQFAVVVDDLEQGVDLIIRGEDLLASTGRQLRLAHLLGRTTAPRFLHHPLLRTADGRKLSKSAHDTGLRELRAAGHTRDELLGLAAHLSGLVDSPRAIAPDALADLFVRARTGDIPAP